MNISRLGTLLILAIGLLGAACKEPLKTVSEQRKVPAHVTTAQYTSVPATLEVPGTVQPRNRIVLSSQINGFVREVHVRAGSNVNAGQVLVTLDSREAQSQKDLALATIQEAVASLEEARRSALIATEMRAAAKANSDLAVATFARYQKLYEARSLSPQEMDEARARRDAALAELAAREAAVSASEDRLKQVQSRMDQASAQSERADVVVGWTVVKAPVAGRVVERAIDPGSAIFPGNTLIVLETAANPQVVAEVATRHLPALKAGLEVQIRSSESGSDAKGRIVEIVPLSNPATHTVQFKVDLPAGFSTPSGGFVRVYLPVGTRNALLAPVTAVRQTGQLTGIFVVDSGSRARFRLVKITPYDAERVELLSGLEPGERFISPLTQELTDGVSLEIRS